MQVDLGAYADVSIHVPNEGNDFVVWSYQAGGDVSIHVPNEGNDVVTVASGAKLGKFQSTFPMKGTTNISVTMSPFSTFQSTFPMKGTT